MVLSVSESGRSIPQPHGRRWQISERLHGAPNDCPSAESESWKTGRNRERADTTTVHVFPEQLYSADSESCSSCGTISHGRSTEQSVTLPCRATKQLGTADAPLPIKWILSNAQPNRLPSTMSVVPCNGVWQEHNVSICEAGVKFELKHVWNEFLTIKKIILPGSELANLHIEQQFLLWLCIFC